MALGGPAWALVLGIESAAPHARSGVSGECIPEREARLTGGTLVTQGTGGGHALAVRLGRFGATTERIELRDTAGAERTLHARNPGEFPRETSESIRPRHGGPQNDGGGGERA